MQRGFKPSDLAAQSRDFRQGIVQHEATIKRVAVRPAKQRRRAGRHGRLRRTQRRTCRPQCVFNRANQRAKRAGGRWPDRRRAEGLDGADGHDLRPHWLFPIAHRGRRSSILPITAAARWREDRFRAFRDHRRRCAAHVGLFRMLNGCNTRSLIPFRRRLIMPQAPRLGTLPRATD